VRYLRQAVVSTFFASFLSLVAWHQSSLVAQTSGAEKNLALGVWNLNLAKSKFLPGPAPISQKRTYELTPGGVKATIRTVYRDGHTTYSETVAEYDGVEYPILGNPDADRIKLKRVDAYTAETSMYHAGSAIATARRVVSEDEKTMTISYTGILNGEQVKNVAVYDRQK
jgi:hypothetical protein